MTPDEQVPGGSIVITPKEFYDGVKSDIAEIKAAVTPLPELRNDVKALGERVTRLEQFKWLMLGAALASGPGTLAVAQYAR